MSETAGLKQRGGPKKKASHQDLNGANTSTAAPAKVIVRAKEQVKDVAVKAGSQWDYKLALTVLTVLGFLTRFYGITHPNSVVFDEVHFGKVRGLYSGDRRYETSRRRLTLLNCSSLPTTSNEPTSSMYILPLANSSSLVLAGSLATMALSSSRTLATHTSTTMSLMSHTALYRLQWAP